MWTTRVQDGHLDMSIPWRSPPGPEVVSGIEVGAVPEVAFVCQDVTSFCRTALGPCNIGFSSEVCAESLYVRIAWLDAS